MKRIKYLNKEKLIVRLATSWQMVKALKPYRVYACNFAEKSGVR